MFFDCYVGSVRNSVVFIGLVSDERQAEFAITRAGDLGFRLEQR